MTNREMATMVYNLISGQRFADFYANEFESHITSEDEEVNGITWEQSKQKTINQLIELLRRDPHWCDETSHFRSE